MSISHLLPVPAAVHASVQAAAPDVTYLSAGRIGAMTAAGLGLLGVLVGGLALIRPASRLGAGARPVGGVVALAAGLLGMAVAAVVVATSDSGIGTGNGRAGAYVGLLVGLIATGLGARVLTRSRRITDGPSR